MSDDQVTIDPQFQPSPPGDGQGRWLRAAGVAGLVVAAFIFGWLLRSPSPAESEPDEEAATSSTALTGETVAASPTTRSPTTTTTEPPEMVGLDVPLGEVMPGFTDTVTMMVWSDAGIDLMRWRPSQTTPETIVSFGHDEPGFAGLDASGTLYALQDENGVLSVRPVWRVVDEPWGWSSAFREAVGLRVAASAWHDTDPGRLAWLSCSRTPRGPSILYTLDVGDGSAEPLPLRPVEDACGENSGVWLGGWGDWGFELGRWMDDRRGDSVVLLDVDGTEIATLGDDLGETTFFVGGSGGTIWTDNPLGPGPSSFLLSLDGQRRDPVPGLADDEWVDGALWSSYGTRLALSPRRSENDVPLIRIVEVATGAVIDEITEPENEVWPRAWSRDGRFLFYERSSGDDGWGPSEVDWVVYDTATGAATELSVPEGRYLGEIRTSEPVPVAEQFTPVEWGIALDEETWGPGVYTVFMTANASPLLPDQVEDVSGRLVWDETVVDLCNIEIREMGDGFLHIGDAFQTIEGCGTNPTAMQDAFDEYGFPETGCVAVRADGVDHEYCAPLD
jgi:hypothetical protein